jgi:phosphatidate cytidylyltransferase
MSSLHDVALIRLLGGIVGLLVVASIVGGLMRWQIRGGPNREMVDNINARIRAWWIMALVFATSVAIGAVGSIVLFTIISFLALREFVTIAPTRPADHRALFWCFFIVTPLEYLLIWFGWYGLFAIFIPVYVSMLVAIRTAVAGDTAQFLQRTATTQWGLLICVYFVSYAPALQMLRIPGYEQQNAKLMVFLVVVVQLSDVLQYIWGKSVGKRRIALSLSPNKTWAGCIGGTLSATAIGAAIWWATPFGPSRRG